MYRDSRWTVGMAYDVFEESAHPRDGGKFTAKGTNEHHYIKQTRNGAMPGKDPATKWDIHHGEGKIGSVEKVSNQVSGGIVRSSRGGAKTGATKWEHTFHGKHEASGQTVEGATLNETMKKLKGLHLEHLNK